MKCLKCDVCNTGKIDAVMEYQCSVCDLGACKACCSKYRQTIISKGQSVGAITCEEVVADINSTWPRSHANFDLSCDKSVTLLDLEAIFNAERSLLEDAFPRGWHRN